MTKKFVLSSLILQILLLAPPLAAETPKVCALCVGAAVQAGEPGAADIPLLMELRAEELSAGKSPVAGLSADQKKNTTVVVSFSPARGSDAVTEIERQTSLLVEWGKKEGPFAGFGVTPDLEDGAMAAYAVKRLAVAAQGQNVASRIVLGRLPLERVAPLFEAGAQAYFDALIVDGAAVGATVRWLAERDPSKKVLALVEPVSPNPLFDAARALAEGAGTAYFTQTTAAAAVAAFDRAMAGDWAADPSARTMVLDTRAAAIEMPVVSFVRGEDLRTILVPRGDASAAAILSLPSDRFAKPRLIDAAGDRPATDVGTRGGRILVGMQPARGPFAFSAEHVEKPATNVTKEAIDIASQRGIAVEEIIRSHQAYRSYQASIEPRYIAKNTTKLRFSIGEGGEVVEAAISGDYFSERSPAGMGRADWVWQDFFINGVRWKYGKIPELPLIQPEKVTQLPLDIHLTNDYRYELVRETDLLGYRTWEVRFEPPANAPGGLPLYRGTVWIDRKTFARVRLSMVQLNLSGEVLSNEERVDFQPFRREGHQPMTAEAVASSDPREILWLPLEVEAQQVVSAGGRANVVLRSTTFSEFRIDPAGFEENLESARASDARMVRETEAGLRYLEKRAGGERVVKEGFDTSRKFMIGGIHHDPGLEFPVVPLGGLNYFNFNLANTGIQTNVFFAGVVVAANATHPNVANTRTNVGVDFFGIAVPTTNSLFRHGIEMTGEAVKALPTNLSFRAGRPFLQFGKIDVSLGVAHHTYQRADDTAPGFEVPSDTFTVTPLLDLQYSRWGWILSGFYSHSRRTRWEPWGVLSEYDPGQKSFNRFGASIAKGFYLPRFQRIGVELNYLDGQRLDRFSKYELGFYGARRVHGIRSGSVRAEKMILGHLSYGFVLSDAIRMEAFYDHALIDDQIAGYRREPFQGVGIGGQTVGPWGTLLRLDIGKSIGRNADDGFVANVVFLKLF